MSRILILANDYKTIANFRMEILQALLGAGHSVDLALPADERNRAFEDMGCAVHPVDITRHGTNPLKEAKLLRTYRGLLRTLRPDVVLTYTVKPNVYGSLACRGRVPVINNVTGMGSVLQGGGMAAKLMLGLQKAALRRSECVFFQNQGNLEAYREAGIVGDNAALLPGSGVNLELHGFVPYPGEETGLDFIIVSRLRQDKGFDELFAMLERILPERRDVRFHIVGWVEEEAYQRRLDAWASEPRLIYHGETTQQEVHELISRCHCLIHPSWHEGMANVLLEAAAAGRPCLASDVPGCREPIENGVTGFTFRVKDPAALTAAVEALLACTPAQRAAMGAAGREKMVREFDRQIVADQYKQKINELTAQDRRQEHVPV